MANGEIARFVQFLFFCHYVFKKPSAAEASENVYMRERVNTGLETWWEENILLILIILPRNIHKLPVVKVSKLFCCRVKVMFNLPQNSAHPVHSGH